MHTRMRSAKGQVFNAQAAVPLVFINPSESTATVVMDRNENSLNEQSSSPPTDSSQDLNALFESELNESTLSSDTAVPSFEDTFPLSSIYFESSSFEVPWE